MRLEQLQYLVALTQHRSLNAASEALFITQQSLGKSIKDLETELGTTLIHRSPKGISFTPDGQEATAIALDILKRIDDFTQHFRPDALSNAEEGTLLILCCQAAYPQILPAILRRFKQKYPRVIIRTMERDSLVIPSLHFQLAAKDPNMDVLSIINLPAPEEYPAIKIPEQLSFSPLLPNHWLACVSSQSPLAKMKTVSMKTLLKQPIIMQSPDYPQTNDSCIDYYLYGRFGTPHVHMIVDNLELYCQSIESNSGVALTSSIYANVERIKNSQEMVLLKIKEKQTVTLGYLIENTKPPSSLINCFIETIGETLKSYSSATNTI